MTGCINNVKRKLGEKQLRERERERALQIESKDNMRVYQEQRKNTKVKLRRQNKAYKEQELREMEE